MTPTLSVDAPQDRSTLPEDRFEKVRLVGVVGGMVSELTSVVQMAWGLDSETLPAASLAKTDSRYCVFGVSPVRVSVVAVSVDAPQDRSRLFSVMFAQLGWPGAVGATESS